MPTLNDGANTCTRLLCHLLDQTHDNGAAIISLVERYISYFGGHYCHLSFHERQDICHEVTISLLCYGEQMRENCPNSWLYAVVRNQCINHVRKQSQRRAALDVADDQGVMVNATGRVPLLIEGVDARVIQRMGCLQKVFDQIEGRETGKVDIAIYTLYAFGLSHLEISRCSRQTVAAIACCISALKSRLQGLMSEYC